MFGSIGGFEALVLALIGLLVFGPRRLPEMGRTLGKAMAEFRRAAAELRTSIEREVSLEEVKETTRSLKDAIHGEIMKGMAPLTDAIPRELKDIPNQIAARADEPKPSDPSTTEAGQDTGHVVKNG